MSTATSPDIGPRVAVTGSTSTRLSIATELGEDDDGNFIGLGLNIFQRTIVESQRDWTMEVTERVAVTETDTMA